MHILAFNYVYVICFVMFMAGLYVVITNKNLLVKVLGLALFQSGIVVFYVFTASISKSKAPIFNPSNAQQLLANPLPHVLMLTAIVVGIATTSVACALMYKIYKNYNTLNEEEIITINQQNK